MKRPDPYLTSGNITEKTGQWLALIRDSVRSRPHLVLRPERCALLIVDVMRFFCCPEGAGWLPASGAVLPNMAMLLGLWRRGGGTVVFTRHCHRRGDDGGMLGRFYDSIIECEDPDSVLVIEPEPGESVLVKNTYDSFHGTGLEKLLRDRGDTQVLVTGVLTHLCCETTARSAFVRGFEVYVAADATASSSESLHTGSLLSIADGFGIVIDTAGAAGLWEKE